MRIVIAEGERFLEHHGERLRLSPEDWLHVVKMTPMGRKVYFQNKSKQLKQLGNIPAEGEVLLAWSRLPVREWRFPCLPE